MGCCEKAEKNSGKVRLAIHPEIYVFLNHSITNNYRTVNNLFQGQSFNENLLYLSPVLKGELIVAYKTKELLKQLDFGMRSYRELGFILQELNLI